MRLAKAAATLDVLCGGRLILGVGVGVIEQEFNALGSSYADRGAITDEAIAIMQVLWTQAVPSHDGRLYHFSGMPFAPKPVQKPHIPIVVGGVSRAAIRRAARVGNGWHPMAMPPEVVHNLQTFASLGVETVVIAPATGNVQGMISMLEMIAREVMPAFT